MSQPTPNPTFPISPAHICLVRREREGEKFVPSALFFPSQSSSWAEKIREGLLSFLPPTRTSTFSPPDLQPSPDHNSTIVVLCRKKEPEQVVNFWTALLFVSRPHRTCPSAKIAAKNCTIRKKASPLCTLNRVHFSPRRPFLWVSPSYVERSELIWLIVEPGPAPPPVFLSLKWAY